MQKHNYAIILAAIVATCNSPRVLAQYDIYYPDNAWIVTVSTPNIVDDTYPNYTYAQVDIEDLEQPTLDEYGAGMALKFTAEARASGLSAQAYARCWQYYVYEWEWTGPPATAPGLDCDYYLVDAGGWVYAVGSVGSLGTANSLAQTSSVADVKDGAGISVDAWAHGSVTTDLGMASGDADMIASPMPPGGLPEEEENPFQGGYIYEQEWPIVILDDSESMAAGNAVFTAIGGGDCDSEAHATGGVNGWGSAHAYSRHSVGWSIWLDY